MKIPDNDYQILRLTDFFYKRYPNPPHNERLKMQDALEYVEDYVAHIKGHKPMHPAEYKRKYGFSTLQYFHDELGLHT